MNFDNNNYKCSVPESSRLTSDYKIKVITGLRKLDRIFLCRKPMFQPFVEFNGSSPGHYWVEIKHNDENEISDNDSGIATAPNGYRESYGWYPSVSSMGKTVDGCLNADSVYWRKKDKNKDITAKISRESGRAITPNDISSRAFDPHQFEHYTPGATKYVTSPYLLPGDNRTQEQVIEEIRAFALEYKDKDKGKYEYSGKWNYKLGAYDENNCHTFLLIMLSELNLADLHIANSKDHHFKEYLSDTIFTRMKNEQPNEQVNEVYNKLKHLQLISLRLKSLLEGIE